MMIALAFYTTSHCHLCEQAEQLLVRLSQQYDIRYSSIEIADNDQLLTQYGTRIPVIKRLDNEMEVGWPFTLHDLTQLMNA